MRGQPRALPRERAGWAPHKSRTRFKHDPLAFGKGDIPSRLDPSLGPAGRRWFNGLKREGRDLARSDIRLMLRSAHLHEAQVRLQEAISGSPGESRLYQALGRLETEQTKMLRALGCTPRDRRQEEVSSDPSVQAQIDLENEPQFPDAPPLEGAAVADFAEFVGRPVPAREGSGG